MARQAGRYLLKSRVGETQEGGGLAGVHETVDLVGVELRELEHGPDALLGDPGRLGGDALVEELLEGGAPADHATNNEIQREMDELARQARETIEAGPRSRPTRPDPGIGEPNGLVGQDSYSNLRPTPESVARPACCCGRHEGPKRPTAYETAGGG